MAEVTELTPLNQSNDQQQIRRSLSGALLTTIHTSYSLLTLRLLTVVACIISELYILNIEEGETERPLGLWVTVCVVLDIQTFITLIAKIPQIRKAQAGQPSESCVLNSATVLLEIAYVGWLLPGNMWLWKCGDCMEEAPVLTSLTTVLVILGYLHFFVPIIFLSILCTFIPIGIVMLMALSNPVQEQQIQSIVDQLEGVLYKQDSFTGELQCLICTIDYIEGDRVLKLKCNEKHYFHEECVKRWLRINASCPICRTAVVFRDLLEQNQLQLTK